MKNVRSILLFSAMVSLIAPGLWAQDEVPPPPPSEAAPDEVTEAPAEETPAETAPEVEAPAPEPEVAPAQEEKSTGELIEEVEAEQEEKDDAYFGPRRPHGQAPLGLGLEPAELVIHEMSMGGKSEDEIVTSKTNRFSFNGFLRVPLRLGIGTGEYHDSVGGGGPGDKKLHVPPKIPDSSYLDWRYINNMGGPWTELQLNYGNDTAAAHISIAAYNLTDGGYRELTSQLGINQSFVSLNLPNLFGDTGGVVINAGVFSNRYGAAGRYSADKYDTYLFGATHVAGENIRMFFDVGDRVTLHLEQGFGGKLDVAPFIENGISEELSEYPYFPYPGPEAQGTTLLHHEHLGLSIDDKFFIGGHFMMSWTDDAVGHEMDDTGALQQVESISGSIINLGADIKLIDSFIGEGYLGFSHVKTENPVRLSGAMEFLHSNEGWTVVNNYYTDNPFENDVPNGNGTIDSLLFQYTFSLSKFLWHPREYWGQYRDLKLSVFGMYNKVKSEDADVPYASDKLKYGADVTYTPAKWFGLMARFDMVQPDMDNSYLSFQQVTGGLIFRSDFVSNEQFVLGYTHYFYGEEVVPVWPNHLHKPDTDIIKISAIMWW